MSNSTPISPLIQLLEESSDPTVAYFSFTADDKGERGVIRANKEGLRLYALDLLKKSVHMEETTDGKNICFRQHEWMVSESGYNLISAVKPEYASREAILADTFYTSSPVKEKSKTEQPGNKGCIGSLLLLIGSLFTIGVAVKCFY